MAFKQPIYCLPTQEVLIAAEFSLGTHCCSLAITRGSQHGTGRHFSANGLAKLGPPPRCLSCRMLVFGSTSLKGPPIMLILAPKPPWGPKQSDQGVLSPERRGLGIALRSQDVHARDGTHLSHRQKRYRIWPNSCSPAHRVISNSLAASHLSCSQMFLMYPRSPS